MKFYKKIKMLAASLILGFVAITAFSTVSAQAINRQLQIGMRGSDIGVMQTFFAKDPSIYPQGLVTNYFGIMTKGAVMNFQARNGIATVGRVGPQTLPVLNAAIANGNMGGVNVGGSAGTGVAPRISQVNVSTNGSANSAAISWTTSELAQGLIYYSSTPLSLYENNNSVTVTNASTASANNSFQNSQSISIQSLQPNTTYYYLIYTTDQDGNVSVYGPSNFRIN